MREWKVDWEDGNTIGLRPAHADPTGIWLAVHDIVIAFVFGILTGASFVAWLFRY